jgi:hypothetical protein
MSEIYMGILDGAASGDEGQDPIGWFHVYFKYSSIIRSNNGNSETVTFKDCYVETVPYYEKRRWTERKQFIDNVYINGFALDISGSWVAAKY